MKTPAVLLAAALLTAACGQKKLTAEEVRAAMPASAELRIDAPAAATAAVPTAGGGPLLAVAAAAGPAPLGVSSALLAGAVNAGVFWALAPIAWLTEVVPPTSCTGTACTWGPGSAAPELNDWMLVVTAAGDGGYDYTLSGARKAPAGSPFVPVMTGRAWPGPVKHRGHGTFQVDFDAAWAGLAHAAGQVQQDFGSIAVDYDARAALALAATFLGSRNTDHPGSDAAHPNRTNAAYAFAASAAGGDLRVGVRNLAPYTAEAPQGRFTLHTQWQAGGAGVADARFGAPDLQPGSTLFEVSQCWAGSPGFTMTYDGATLTDKAACAIAPGAPVVIDIP